MKMGWHQCPRHRKYAVLLEVWYYEWQGGPRRLPLGKKPSQTTPGNANQMKYFKKINKATESSIHSKKTEKDGLSPEVWASWSHICDEPAQRNECPAAVCTLRQAVLSRVPQERRLLWSHQASWLDCILFSNVNMAWIYASMGILQYGLHGQTQESRSCPSTKLFILWTFSYQGFPISYAGTLETVRI